MSDLIDRKILLAKFEDLCEMCGKRNENSGVMCRCCSLDDAISIAEDLPSAEPERKKGRWQRRKGFDCWECSECHAVLESDDIARHNFYYCYHCCADMMNEDGYMNLERIEHE